jgi:hypothetical protein
VRWGLVGFCLRGVEGERVGAAYDWLSRCEGKHAAEECEGDGSILRSAYFVGEMHGFYVEKWVCGIQSTITELLNEHLLTDGKNAAETSTK